MQIAIQQRMLPFSHTPGMKVVIPRSTYVAQIFPCLIRIFDWTSSQPVALLEIIVQLDRFFQEFTICEDLERGCVRVWGKSSKGYVEYHLIAGKKGTLAIILDRAPSSGVSFVENGRAHRLVVKESRVFLSPDLIFTPSEVSSVCDRLCLGSHKKMDWEAVNRRLLLSEILPVWHRLGQWVPVLNQQPVKGGVFALLEECNSLHGVEAENHWQDVIRVGFSDLLVPQWNDVHHLGIPLLSIAEKLSPLDLLAEGSRLIRNLFIKRQQSSIFILPRLLPSLHSGRLLDVDLGSGLLCSIEWTKKTIRRIVMRSTLDEEVFLECKSNIRSFRVRRSKADRGQRVGASAPIRFTAGSELFFDNFE